MVAYSLHLQLVASVAQTILLLAEMEHVELTNANANLEVPSIPRILWSTFCVNNGWICVGNSMILWLNQGFQMKRFE